MQITVYEDNAFGHQVCERGTKRILSCTIPWNKSFNGHSYYLAKTRSHYFIDRMKDKLDNGGNSRFEGSTCLYSTK